MAILTHLAMTAAEFAKNAPVPEAPAWMACHFSPYGTGLTNLPKALPPDSLLILNDRTPIHSHDPRRIAKQLSGCVREQACAGVLLDLERGDNPESEALAEILVQELPCPVGVSACYARDLNCPVFLPPLPPDVPLGDHLAPWLGREVWLELSLSPLALTLTESGCARSPLPPDTIPETAFEDAALHCHYHIQLRPDVARFTLWRTQEDLTALLQEAEALGVARTVALWQELPSLVPPKAFPSGEPIPQGSQ